MDVAVVYVAVAIPSIRSDLHASSGVVELVIFAHTIVYASSRGVRLGPVEWTSVRARRAVKPIGVAIVVVVAAAVAYLGPGWARSRSQGSVPQLSPAPAVGRVSVASFGDADHGAVLLVREFGTNRSYITSNGGRTWTQQGQGYIQTTFFDRHHAVAIENGVAGFWTTGDAGRTWVFEELPANALRSGLTTNVIGRMTFMDALHGW